MLFLPRGETKVQMVELGAQERPPGADVGSRASSR